MLRAEVIPVNRLHKQDRTCMLQLMRRYYENVRAKQFDADLAAKDCVIVLRDRDRLCGFSTQVLLTKTLSGQTIRLLFSGDTVIGERHRNSLALPLAWGRMMLDRLREQPQAPLYWLLISKGYKTYRYLSVFFHDYFPQPGRTLSPFEETLLTSFSRELFDGMLDREHWVLRSSPHRYRLRAGVADISAVKRQKPDIAFFETANPGHASGDELICLARFTEENVTPFILKRLIH